jgi:hypothetical protein
MNNRLGGTQLVLLCAGLALGCGDSEQDGAAQAGSGGSAGSPAGSAGSAGNGSQATGGTNGSGYDSAGIQMRFAAPVAPSGGLNRLLAFAGGGAVRPGLESLSYYIYSVQICESLEASGSGFNNPRGCLELYSAADRSALNYDLDGNWTALADAARARTEGFVDLLDPTSRATLGGTTPLQSEHVRSYHYGIITWSLPIKVKATVALGDGSVLYTHDGPTRVQTIGADNFRDYFTEPSTALNVAPAEPAVVILGNGGNWFKFQNPLVISQADLDQKRQWVLDLVFNPEGIVKGFSGDGAGRGNVRELNGSGPAVRGITVPMLDLAPVPHRASEQVVRESYLGAMTVGGNHFDARIELYSVEGDPNRTVYGVDVKSLVTARTSNVPPDMSKISSLTTETDGSLSFLSFRGTPVISGFHRVAEELGTTTASIKCATHADRVGAEGGAAIVVDSCPSANIDVTFTLVGRRNLEGDIPLTLEPADAGVTDAGSPGDGGNDAPDAGAAGDAG